MAKRIQLVVLDDDPTGIQTVHGCYVLTQWDTRTLTEALADSQSFFYVLTNTRARTPAQAKQTIREVVANVVRANRQFGHELVFMSRSDSTLRSHFPLEIDTIIETAGTLGLREPDAIFMVPAFFEGGRVTVGDTHYLTDDGRRIPTAETEFARDSVFAYSTSHLPSYIAEKTAGRIARDQIESITLSMLRGAGSQLGEFISQLTGRQWVVVNAEKYDDLDRFSTALRAALGADKSFAFQCAASIVKSLSGIEDKPLLRDELGGADRPGMFIVGSHVTKTTEQLARLLAADGAVGIEVDVSGFVDQPAEARSEALSGMRQALQAGKAPVVYTSREEVAFDSSQRRLEMGQKLSLMLASLVTDVASPVAYVVAKGGITSHDVLASGLQVAKARVAGQILPGVPVVRTHAACPLGEIPCVIFPGNVGDANSLLEVYEILSSSGQSQ